MGGFLRKSFPVSFISCLAVCMLLSLSLPLLAGSGAGEARAAAGSGWEVIDLPVSGMLHISAVDADVAFVAGANTLLKTVNGGTNWSTIFDSEDTHIYDIDAVDAGNIWAVVLVSQLDEQGMLVSKTLQVVKSVNGGGSWTTAYAVDAPYIWDYMHMSISAVDPFVVWVALEGGKILRSIDGGNTWSECDSGIGQHPEGTVYNRPECSIAAVDANTAWVAGWGLDWTRSILNPFGNPTIVPGPPWPPAYKPVICRTVDGGATWEVKQSGTYDEGYYDISTAGPASAIAVGDDITYNIFPSFTMLTTYATVIPYFYLTVASTSAVQSSYDGGLTWVPQLVNYTGEIRSVDMVDPSTAWVVGDDGAIFKTLDGGISGYPQASGLSQAPGISEPIWEIDAVDPSTAWAIAYTYTNSAVLRTTCGGDALPDIVSVTPRSGGAGSEVTIDGCDFGGSRGSSYASFGTVPATEYVSWSDTRIVVKMPAGVVGDVKVTVTTAAGTSNPKPFTSTAPLPMPCGAGSAPAVLMLGIGMGLLSVAGSVRHRAKRRSKA